MGGGVGVGGEGGGGVKGVGEGMSGERSRSLAQVEEAQGREAPAEDLQ